MISQHCQAGIKMEQTIFISTFGLIFLVFGVASLWKLKGM